MDVQIERTTNWRFPAFQYLGDSNLAATQAFIESFPYGSNTWDYTEDGSLVVETGLDATTGDTLSTALTPGDFIFKAFSPYWTIMAGNGSDADWAVIP